MEEGSIDLLWHYYKANQFWVYVNAFLITPFLVACFNRLRQPAFNKHLWTDHLSRLGLIVTVAFYPYEMAVKYAVDGGDSICQKGFFIHHVFSMFIITPLIINDYIPWWVNPIGFLHGFLIFFPEFEALHYVYAVFLFVFQFGLYQTPYRNLRGYWVTRYAINGVWVFCIMLLIDECSNFLPLSPD